MARTGKYSYELGSWYWADMRFWIRSDKPNTLFSDKSSTIYNFSGVYSRYRTKDPDWKVLVYKRRDASGAYARRIITIKPRVLTTDASYISNGVRIDTWKKHLFACNILALAQSADDTSLKDLALARLKRKISSRNNQMNAMVPVVELREFRDLIKSLTFLATDLVYALIAIKKTKGKSAYQFAAHAWLTFSFAARPLISEIDTLAKRINQELFDSGGQVYTDYGAAKKEWFSRYSASSTGGYGVNGNVYSQLRHSLSYRYVAGWKAPLRSANNYSVGASFGLEFGALIPTAWELIPFSWLIDYFSTVGAYLDDTFTTDQSTTIYCNCTKKYSVSGEFQYQMLNRSGMISSSVRGRGSEFAYDLIDRTVLSSIPTRALRFKSIDEIGKNAINKLLNLCSVLVGGKALSHKY